MPVSLLASLAAIALAAGAPEQAMRDAALAASTSVPDHGVLDEALSAAGTSAEALREEALAALAPAPVKAVLTTRSFGTVTVDHRAHLARKAHCVQCHGPGPVTKLQLTPRVAHDRCIGCHREQQRGPMNCRECHVVKPPPPEPTTLQAKAPEASAPDGKRVALASATIGSQGKAVGAPAAAAFQPIDLDERAQRDHRFTRILSAGFAGSSAGGATEGGFAVYVTARQDGWLMSASVESSGRTVGLLGAGAVLPLYRRFNAVAQAVGGFDAVQQPGVSMMPALGGRVGVEWLGDRMTAGICVTGLSDLARRTDALGGTIGGFSTSLAATVGWVIAD